MSDAPAGDPRLKFDEQLLRDVLGEDELGAVIRAHIHIEATIIDYLRVRVPHYEHLPYLRYEGRIRLATALGFRADLLDALKRLGDLRNSFGHDLHTKLTNESVDKIFDALPTHKWEAQDDPRIAAAIRFNAKHYKAEKMPKMRLIMVAMALKVGALQELAKAIDEAEAGGRVH